MAASTEEKNDFFPTFCDELRIRTKIIHDKSDKLVNMKLVVVLTDARLWGETIAEFYFIFRTLEECIAQHRDDPIIGSIYMDQAIFRTKALERDLEFYLGANWQSVVKPSPVVETYCNHLHDISQRDPLLLVAYIHSMYLGLLAGGQIIKRIVRRTLGLSGEEGLEMFSFGSTSRLHLKTEFMESVNNLNLSREEKERIVEEKTIVFQMNNNVVNNIKPSLANYKRLIWFSAATVVAISGIVFLLVRYFQE